MTSSIWGRTFADGLARLGQAMGDLEATGPAWDAQLAAWFGDRFPSDGRRVLALPSGAPPSPGGTRPPSSLLPEAASGRTFGVVVDAVASIDRRLLGRALDAIASSATASDVRRVRLVLCESIAHDAGWLAPQHLAGRVRPGRRAGTCLQHGVDLLHADASFPAAGPLLLLTDGHGERVRVHHDHAWLTTGHLRFATRGPVFHLT